MDPLLMPHANGRPALIQVGKLTLQPEQYLAEGGFAKVYLARLGNQMVALKTINTSTDKASYGPVLQELDIMKQLDHKNIVRYLDSQVYRRQDGSYLIHICMEYCSGGGLLDFMNRVKQLREQQIWTILKDVVEGVAYMHSKGIVNRDIKVENVLLSMEQYGITYKLCDFGSCTTVQYAPGHVLSQSDMTFLQEELDKMTTLSYRAPEMCDLYKVRKVGLTAKTDVWAIGVLTYKLCYYDVPFAEADGKLAILNSRYQIPSAPQYSERLIELIRSCLTDSAIKRPTAYQLNLECCNVLQIPNTVEEYHSPFDIVPTVDKDLPPVPVLQQPLYEEPTVIPNARRGRVQNHSASGSISQDVFSSPAQDVFSSPPQDVFSGANSQSAYKPNSNFDDVFGQPSASSVDVYPSEVTMPDDYPVQQQQQTSYHQQQEPEQPTQQQQQRQITYPQQQQVQSVQVQSPHQDLVGLFQESSYQNYSVQSGIQYQSRMQQQSYSSNGANYFASSYSSHSTSVFSQQQPQKPKNLFQDLYQK